MSNSVFRENIPICRLLKILQRVLSVSSDSINIMVTRDYMVDQITETYVIICRRYIFSRCGSCVTIKRP